MWLEDFDGEVNLNSWMEPQANWHTPDPGIPLYDYYGKPIDPLELWRTQPGLRKVVGFVARQISMLPWHAFQRLSDTDRRRVRDSPLERLFRAPDRFVSGVQLTSNLVTDLLLYDRFCAIYVDGSLIRLSPRRWEIRSDWLGRARRVLLRSPDLYDEQFIEITDEPLMIGWGWSDTVAGGISPMITLSQLLDETTKSLDWRSKQWDSRPAIDGYLKHPASFRSQDARSTFAASWSNWRDGGKGTPILEDGMEYEILERPSSKDALDLEGRKLTDEQVAGAFHMPPELLGIRPGNYSNIQAFRSMLYGPTLGPTIMMLQQAANAIVDRIDYRDGIYVEMSREAALNGSLMEQATTLQTMVGGPYMLRSEARARLNLPHIDGTEELIVPLNVVEGGQASPRDSGSQNRKMLIGKATDAPTELFDAERELLQSALAGWLASLQAEVGDAVIDVEELLERFAAAAAAGMLPSLTRSARAAAQRVISEAGVEDWADEVMDAYLAAMAETKGEQITRGVGRRLIEDEDRSHAWEILAGFTAMWAATAVTDAAGFGGQDAARHAGMSRKVWLTTSGNSRDSHAAMHGETVGIDDVFSNGARWPGDINLIADESAGCLCTIAFE